MNNTKKINIIFAGGFAYPQGYAATKHVQAFLSYAVSEGYRPYVVSLMGWTHSKQWRKEGCHDGVTYVSVSCPSGQGWIPGVFHYWSTAIKKLKSWRVRDEHNVVIFYGQPTLQNLPVLIAMKALGCQIVFFIVEDYNVYEFSGEKGARSKTIRMTRRLEPLVKVFARGIIVLSTALERKFKPTGLPVALVPIMTSFADAQSPALSSLRRIVYAGTYGAKDDVDCIINAFYRVHEQRPEVQLNMIGTGPDRGPYMEMTAGNDAVKWIGHLEDDELQKALDEPGIMCMTRTNSLYANAGFPYKLSEYLKTGNPVVASRVSDVGMYLESGRDAMLVTPGDSQDLAKAMLFLITNPAEAHEIGLRGQRRGKECFSSEINGRQMLEFIHQLVSSR